MSEKLFLDPDRSIRAQGETTDSAPYRVYLGIPEPTARSTIAQSWVQLRTSLPVQQ